MQFVQKGQINFTFLKEMCEKENKNYLSIVCSFNPYLRDIALIMPLTGHNLVRHPLQLLQQKPRATSQH